MNKVRKSNPDEERRLAEISGELLDNASWLDALSQESAQRVRRVRDRLGELEQAIVLVDRILRISQPPKQGKLGIRWWKRNGQDRERHPVLVRYLQVKGGRWRASPVERLRQDEIERGGTSALNAGETYELAKIAVLLIKGYDGAWSRMKRLQTELVRLDISMQADLDYTGDLVRGLHRQVTTNLLNAGYLLDDDALSLMDDPED